ncbi:hypothetical protein BDN71DRAFT_1436225 [Pleurotus eryngii]|uniref:Uncharacterized protein n=1 Tax=Pleurotus eryngii TaxID=5323 RepID=A0A9P6D126_PLEER|nr:hypothetical protein BDN71DRAFT_1436225 [Pleurotus eryngii]
MPHMLNMFTLPTRFAFTGRSTNNVGPALVLDWYFKYNIYSTEEFKPYKSYACLSHKFKNVEQYTLWWPISSKKRLLAPPTEINNPERKLVVNQKGCPDWVLKVGGLIHQDVLVDGRSLSSNTGSSGFSSGSNKGAA